MNQMNLINKRVAFCMVCGECLGEYRKYYAEEHIKKHPSHNDFLVRKIVDPLLLPNLDEWLNIRLTNQQLTGCRDLTKRKSDDNLKEPN